MTAGSAWVRRVAISRRETMTNLSAPRGQWSRSVWRSAPDYAGAAFVWAVWAAMLAGTLLFIKNYGVNVPYMDE